MLAAACGMLGISVFKPMNANPHVSSGASRRTIAAVSDSVSFAAGQAFYLVAEGIAVVTRRPSLRREMRAVRKAASGYWSAKALRRQDRLDEAFARAKGAFAALHEADRRETFLQMGGMVITLLDRLAKEAQIPGGARTELNEALEVFRAMKQDPGPPSWALDRMIAWLEKRVEEERSD
jgi:hypothetical protein